MAKHRRKARRHKMAGHYRIPVKPIKPLPDKTYVVSGQEITKSLATLLMAQALMHLISPHMDKIMERRDRRMKRVQVRKLSPVMIRTLTELAKPDSFLHFMQGWGSASSYYFVHATMRRVRSATVKTLVTRGYAVARKKPNGLMHDHMIFITVKGREYLHGAREHEFSGTGIDDEAVMRGP